MGGGEFTNAVSGKIRLGKETLATIDGHWDDKVNIKEKKTGVRFGDSLCFYQVRV